MFAGFQLREQFFEIAAKSVDGPFAVAAEARQVRMEQALAQDEPAIQALMKKAERKLDFGSHAEKDMACGFGVLANGRD